MLLFLDAITRIQEQALFLGTHVTRTTLIQEMLTLYLQHHDAFSEYLSPEEYAAFQTVQQRHYSGVGMEVERDAAGQLVCLPYPDSPAEQAGITFQDIILAIDGNDVQELSIWQVVMLMRGDEGSQVTFTVEREGRSLSIVVTRSLIAAQSVILSQADAVAVISISTFTPGTRRELEAILHTIPPEHPLVLDVRGNPGGDFHSALDSAMLFLPQGLPLAYVKTRKHEKIYESILAPVNTTSPLYLWQDERTASAAEVFIAALTAHGRGESIGHVSYGKGKMQDVIELLDGSALILTTGTIHTPDRNSLHDRGLTPTYMLEMPAPTTREYLSKLHEVLPSSHLSSSDMEVSEHEEQLILLDFQKMQEGAEESTQETPADVYLLCFDKDFDTANEAKAWHADAVQNLVKADLSQHALQRRQPSGVRFMSCLGVFATLQDAEHKKVEFARQIGLPVFIHTIAYTAP